MLKYLPMFLIVFFSRMVVFLSPINKWKSELSYLEGKSILVEVEGHGVKVYMAVSNGALSVKDDVLPPDITMKASLKTFLMLFLGLKDADTAFFNREILISGDMEAGVRFKNLIARI